MNLICLNILNSQNIKSTWFITHQSSILDNLRSDLKVELGIHPNFNKILENINNRKDFREIIQGILKVVPEAKSIRSHSLTQNSKILDFVSNHKKKISTKVKISIKNRFKLVFFA